MALQRVFFHSILHLDSRSLVGGQFATASSILQKDFLNHPLLKQVGNFDILGQKVIIKLKETQTIKIH